MTTQHYVSVTDPIGRAIDCARRILFQPFDLGKWFAIGFCAWLAQLGEQGFHGSANYNFGDHRNDIHREWERAHHFVVENLAWMVPLAIFLAVVGIAVWVLFVWLSSRGRFMFLHCVALDRAEVQAPWQKFAREANSLFLFRIVLGLLSGVPLLALGIVFAVTIVSLVNAHGPLLALLPLLIGIGLVMIALAIAFALISKFTTDFIVPIMVLRGKACVESWREFLGLIRPNAGHFVLYILFQIVIALAIGAIVLVVVVATCCIAGCFLAIPYIGTVLLLPVLIFKRAYSLYYLAQYGPEYDVFPPPTQTA